MLCIRLFYLKITHVIFIILSFDYYFLTLIWNLSLSVVSCIRWLMWLFALSQVITTPKRGRHSSCSLTHVEKDEAGEADMTIDMEKEVDDICSEAPPATMIEGACEALTQEIKLLQVKYSSKTC